MIAIITLMFVLCIDGIPLRFDNFDTLKLKHRLLQRKTSALSSDLEQHEHLRSEIHGRSCGHSLIAHLQQLSVDDFRVFASKEGISTAPPRSIRLTGETGESRNITNQPGDDHAQGNLQKRVLRGSSSSTSSPATSGPSTIRIVNDFQFASSQLSQSQQNAVQLAVTTAVNIVKKFVKVTSPLTSPLLVRAEVMCNPGTINSTLRAGLGAGVPGADLYLIVTAQSGGTCSTNSTNPSRSGAVSGTLAWAMACDYSLQAGSIGRPILSVINLCPGGVEAAIQAVEASGGVNIKGGVMDVLVHEMMHALGLSSTMYSSWLSQSSGTPYANGGTVASGSVGTYLTTPNSLSQAQQTLNCSSLAGLPLEEEGSRASALSHWEFRFFYQELMTPFLFALGVQRQRLSSVTTAALQDTGWYTPRVEYVMPLDVQQVPAMGCSLALNSCAAYQESFPDTYYCSPGSSGTQQQEAVGDPANLACYTNTDPATCDVTPFSDNCGLLHPANLPCSSSYLGSQLPPGSTNLLSALSSSSSFSAAQDFYVSFGAAYGPDAVCLPWRNSSGGDLSYSGCFLTSCTADGGTTPVISAIVNNAFVNLPCTPDTTLLLRDYLPVQDLSTTLQCPSLTTAQTICSQLSAAPDSCGNSGLPCVSGTCTDGGTCVCDLEYMGADCSIHVSQVTDFDDPSMMSPAVTPSPLIPPAHHPILFPPSPSPSRIITPPLNPYTKPSHAPPPKTRPAKLPKSPNNKPKPMSDNNAKNPKPSPSAAATPTANPSAKKASPTLVQKKNNKKFAAVVPAALGPALPVDMRASTPVESIMWSSSLSGGQQEGLSTIINSVVSLPSEVEHIPVDDALVGDEMADLSTGHYQQGKDSDMTAALNALSTLGSVNAVIGLAEEERTEK